MVSCKGRSFYEKDCESRWHREYVRFVLDRESISVRDFFIFRHWNPLPAEAPYGTQKGEYEDDTSGL